MSYNMKIHKSSVAKVDYRGAAAPEKSQNIVKNSSASRCTFFLSSGKVWF